MLEKMSTLFCAYFGARVMSSFEVIEEGGRGGGGRGGGEGTGL